MNLNWKHLTLIGAGLLVGLVVLAYGLGWPPFSVDAPDTAAPGPAAAPTTTSELPPVEAPPTTTARPFLETPQPATTTTATTTTTTVPPMAEASDPEELADGTGEDVPCWRTIESADVFSDFVLLENVCVLDDGPEAEDGPADGQSLAGEDGPAEGQSLAGEDGLAGGEGFDGLSGEDGPGADALAADDLFGPDAMTGLLDPSDGDVPVEEPAIARVGWRCATDTGRLEMFASTGRPPALLPNDEAVVLLRWSSQDEPAGPTWEVRAERDDEGNFESRYIVYEGLWRPGPALDHDRAGLPTSEADFPLTGIQDDAPKTLPENEETTVRSRFDQRQEHAQHAPHLVHAPQGTVGDALEALRRTDQGSAVLYVSIGSAQVAFDVSGWEDHIDALDPCGDSG